MSILYYMCHNC